jgi:hypothetical protein
VGSSRTNSGRRGTPGAAAGGGGTDSGSSSDAEGDTSRGGWNGGARAAGRPGPWGRNMQQQQQPQQASGAKVSGVLVSSNGHRGRGAQRTAYRSTPAMANAVSWLTTVLLQRCFCASYGLTDVQSQFKQLS